uniref:Uncharacterized protein n=2 Tax=Candidatus Bipolaricaulota TaxID=67810 RepID=H5SNJ4_9BACT|nr:hypothetical protein HGMM_F52D02C09 [uncultured Acetothermia bacterium]BAL59058.1 hypothetical protein HGMM_OP3C213 [Candidatus Acetothermum autotrophicum]
MLFEANTQQWRRWIGTRGVVFNVLRLCARRAYTVYELSGITLRDAGLTRSVFDVLSDINVSVVVGESERRELITVVGTVPDPTTSGGVTYLLRTTLLAFLLSPALALAEPDAYGKYLRAWVAYPQTRKYFVQAARAQLSGITHEGLHALYEFVWRTALVFPGYLSARWMVVAPGLDAQLDLTPPERKHVFGEFFLPDVRTIEESPSHSLKLFVLGRGIPQHASELLHWLSTAERFRLEETLRALRAWAAWRLLWEIKRVERRAWRVVHGLSLNTSWGAEDPPMGALQVGRFSLYL